MANVLLIMLPLFVIIFVAVMCTFLFSNISGSENKGKESVMKALCEKGFENITDFSFSIKYPIRNSIREFNGAFRSNGSYYSYDLTFRKVGEEWLLTEGDVVEIKH